jgi:MYXO-CTERM domain-containing protein
VKKLLALLPLWGLLAMVPGPCAFDPGREWDCDLGNPCPENFACANDGFCKSADIACEGDEVLCSYDGLERVGLCISRAGFDTDPSHCGGCFERCTGGAACVDGACVDEPPAGECVPERGNYDCAEGSRCEDGDCVEGGEGPNGILLPCEGDDDCAGGLCARGVCTQPCDFGCPFGFTCDAEAIPGGVCAPTSCADDPLICADGLVCSAAHDACVRPEAASCGSAPASLLGLLGLLALLFRRRRLSAA